jgi:hypothetical protein
VVVVFDEFPSDDILRPDGSIDEERFPNFAELASISTWFPNAHTVYDSTFKAVPAILDGRLPRTGTAPDVRSHKPSIFHVLDRLGYEVFKVESASAVCPPAICPGARTRRPGVLHRLAGGGRPARFHHWLGQIRRRAQPAFYFHHALLPHEPWIYLPSGRQSRPAGEDPVRHINHDVGFGDPDLTVHNHLRHLLQVGYTDHLVGELLARLRRTGLLERALLVVTADHGYSFQVGVKSRRLISDRNVEEIAPVPLFVKAPGQTEGEVDRSLAWNIDIVATVADLLGTRVFYRQDGRSVLSRAVGARRDIAVRTRNFRHVVRIAEPELAHRRAARRALWARQFGTGTESELLYGDPWTRAYDIGPHRELIGRRVATLRVSSGGQAPGAERASVANAALFGAVSRHERLLPTRVTGPLHGVPVDEHRDLALAVDGRIQATGRSFDLAQPRREFFSFMLPESVVHSGANRLELFELLPGGELVRVGGV